MHRCFKSDCYSVTCQLQLHVSSGYNFAGFPQSTFPSVSMATNTDFLLKSLLDD